eukprot:351479-Chlamydomonas_euryale.AAC.21
MLRDTHTFRSPAHLPSNHHGRSTSPSHPDLAPPGFLPRAGAVAWRRAALANWLEPKVGPYMLRAPGLLSILGGCSMLNAAPPRLKRFFYLAGASRLDASACTRDGADRMPADSGSVDGKLLPSASSARNCDCFFLGPRHATSRH